MSYKTSNPDEIYVCRSVLCQTYLGLPVDLITVSSYEGISARNEVLPSLRTGKIVNSPRLFPGKQIIFLTARVHPGETGSSYVMEGLLHFLTYSMEPSAISLRKKFVFKFVPMLNPDGVQQGHYRTDSEGANLNRYYHRPDPFLQPTVYAVSNLIQHYNAKRHTKIFFRRKSSARSFAASGGSRKSSIRSNVNSNSLSSSSRIHSQRVNRKSSITNNNNNNNNQSVDDVNNSQQQLPPSLSCPSAFLVAADEYGHEERMEDDLPYLLPPSEIALTPDNNHQVFLLNPSPNQNPIPKLSIVSSSSDRDDSLPAGQQIDIPSIPSRPPTILRQQRKTSSARSTNSTLLAKTSIGGNSRCGSSSIVEYNNINNTKGRTRSPRSVSGRQSSKYPTTERRRSSSSSGKSSSACGVLFYVDIHNHVSKPSTFIYGNFFHDSKAQTESLVFAGLLNHHASPYFDLNGCVFSEGNMRQKDRKDKDLSKEGSGRVAIHRHTGIVHCYTMECNYHGGRLVSSVNPLLTSSEASARKTGTSFAFTPQIYHKVHKKRRPQNWEARQKTDE